MTAAAEKSVKGVDFSISAEQFARWVIKLPSKDKDSMIIRLLNESDLNISADLRKRAVKEIRGEQEPGKAAPHRATAEPSANFLFAAMRSEGGIARNITCWRVAPAERREQRPRYL